MEIFSEIYSMYFRAMEEVLRQAELRPLSGREIQKVLSERTFAESAISIFPKLHGGDWPLLKRSDAGYMAAIAPLPENPLTYLQKAWLRAILEDHRFRLFFCDDEISEIREQLRDIAPLYRQQDFYIFDKAADGDDYASIVYQTHFRHILTAIRQKSALFIQYEGGKGSRISGNFQPFKLEYSQRDDKFRALCYRRAGNKRKLYTLNVGRIVSANPHAEAPENNIAPVDTDTPSQIRQVVIEITRERNALERCMVQFAHFEKRTEYDEATDKYICTVRYYVMDETELVIRVLSFGPTIKVLGPEAFVEEIRERVKNQTLFLQRLAEV